MLGHYPLIYGEHKRVGIILISHFTYLRIGLTYSNYYYLSYLDIILCKSKKFCGGDREKMTMRRFEK